MCFRMFSAPNGSVCSGRRLPGRGAPGSAVHRLEALEAEHPAPREPVGRCRCRSPLPGRCAGSASGVLLGQLGQLPSNLLLAVGADAPGPLSVCTPSTRATLVRTGAACLSATAWTRAIYPARRCARSSHCAAGSGCTSETSPAPSRAGAGAMRIGTSGADAASEVTGATSVTGGASLPAAVVRHEASAAWNAYLRVHADSIRPSAPIGNERAEAAGTTRATRRHRTSCARHWLRRAVRRGVGPDRQPPRREVRPSGDRPDPMRTVAHSILG